MGFHCRPGHDTRYPLPQNGSIRNVYFSYPQSGTTIQIYVRPMSLTRSYEWMKSWQPTTNDTQSAKLSPSINEIGIRVEIDGKEVDVLHKQEIEEYMNENQVFNAYLLSVEKPQHLTNRPYWVIKVELTDNVYGDCDVASITWKNPITSTTPPENNHLFSIRHKQFLGWI